MVDCAGVVSVGDPSFFCDPLPFCDPVSDGDVVTVPVTACDWSVLSVFDPVDVWDGMPFWYPLPVCHAPVVYDCLPDCDPSLTAPEARRANRSVRPTWC